jgi:hypothetical protein
MSERTLEEMAARWNAGKPLKKSYFELHTEQAAALRATHPTPQTWWTWCVRQWQIAALTRAAWKEQKRDENLKRERKRLDQSNYWFGFSITALPTFVGSYTYCILTYAKGLLQTQDASLCTSPCARGHWWLANGGTDKNLSH